MKITLKAVALNSLLVISVLLSLVCYAICLKIFFASDSKDVTSIMHLLVFLLSSSFLLAYSANELVKNYNMRNK